MGTGEDTGRRGGCLRVALIVVAVALVALAVGVCSLFTGGDGEGRVEIDVVDPDGQTPDDYRISFTPDVRTAVQRRATGYVYFGVPAGRYSVTVTSPGLAPTTIEIQVPEGRTSEFTVELDEPSPG